MRLINTATMKLEEFMGVQLPAYAILSHTWEEGEVTLQDFANLKTASQKKGFEKIDHSCRQARQTGLNYAWVDTCCIDKTNGAELTEAINSMFQWYNSSAVCYTYLSDLNTQDSVSAEDPMSQFARCRWFTRGWTLQELIAPTIVEFYDRDWKFRGTKASLSRAISTVTGIDDEVLHDCSMLFAVPVARRMFWATNRQTTRIEDIAYSLLGIFDVNMPMLYGEGEKAFIRLQQEIAKETNDMTLFAWQAAKTDRNQSDQSNTQKYRGIFAKSPAEFINAGDIVPSSDHRLNEEFALTNKGLRINVVLAKGSTRDRVLRLNCLRRNRPEQDIGIYLKHYGASVYARGSPEELAVVAEWHATSHPETIYITKNITKSLSNSIEKIRHHAIRCRHGLDGGSIIVNALPERLWDAENQLFLTAGLSSFAGILTLNPGFFPGLFIVACVMSDGLPPWVAFLDETKMEQITPAIADPNYLFKLPKSTMMSKKVAYDKNMQPMQFSISISLEERAGEQEPMYCIDMQVDETDPGSLPSAKDYMARLRQI